MSGFLESMALHEFGFTDEQIAQIDAVRPDVEFLLNLLKTEMPRIVRVINVAQMAIKVYNANQKEFDK
jgi:hypothetical protein